MEDYVAEAKDLVTEIQQDASLRRYRMHETEFARRIGVTQTADAGIHATFLKVLGKLKRDNVVARDPPGLGDINHVYAENHGAHEDFPGGSDPAARGSWVVPRWFQFSATHVPVTDQLLVVERLVALPGFADWYHDTDTGARQSFARE